MNRTQLKMFDLLKDLKENHGVSAITYTMAVIGNADINASLIFDQSSFKTYHQPFYILPVYYSKNRLENQ